MKSYSLAILTFFLVHFQLNAQYTSTKVDSLKKIITVSSGNKRIDALNELVTNYLVQASLQSKLDSANPYAIIANNEAKKGRYKSGEAKSLLNLAAIENIKLQIAKTKYNPLPPQILLNFERLVQQSISIATETGQNLLLGDAYYLLSELQVWKNKQPEVIESYKRAADYYHKAGEIGREGEILTWISMYNIDKGNFEDGFTYGTEALRLVRENAKTSTKQWDHEIVQWALSNMSELYKAAGDYQTALDYLRQSYQYAVTHDLPYRMNDYIGMLFNHWNKPDSALVYLIPNMNNQPNNIWAKLFVGESYLLKKDYDKALVLFNIVMDSMNKSKPTLNTRILLNLGKAHFGKSNLQAALQYARQGLDSAEKNTNKSDLIIAFEFISKVYHQLGNNDSAYKYLLQHYSLKDPLFNNQFLWRLNNYKRLAEDEKKLGQIRLLNKENQLRKQELKQEALIKKGLIAGLILLILFSVVVFRILILKRKNEVEKQRLENEKQQAELRQRAAELEMQALRAQMNPHFIFNCLSSINKFILKNESQAASDYLTRFSRLIRRVLTNSQLSLISLSDEIEMLKLYLDMERLRFDNAFDYNIVYANTIEPETIYIPPMLLQPFCENAIWHGLMHKEGQGKLEIEMSVQDGELHCIIADNGIGREKATALKTKSGEKQKSFGLKVTSERLALFSNNQHGRSYYRTEDIYDAQGNTAGTKVNLVINYKDAVHELVNTTV
jgi:hypothetical protein